MWSLPSLCSMCIDLPAIMISCRMGSRKTGAHWSASQSVQHKALVNNIGALRWFPYKQGVFAWRLRGLCTCGRDDTVESETLAPVVVVWYIAIPTPNKQQYCYDPFSDAPGAGWSVYEDAKFIMKHCHCIIIFIEHLQFDDEFLEWVPENTVIEPLVDLIQVGFTRLDP